MGAPAGSGPLSKKPVTRISPSPAGIGNARKSAELNAVSLKRPGGKGGCRMIVPYFISHWGPGPGSPTTVYELIETLIKWPNHIGASSDERSKSARSEN